MSDHTQYMQHAIQLATENVTSGRGGPFGCVIVRKGEVLSATPNTVTSTNDPTAHAEINAIRAACTKLESFSLEDCDVYTSCEPCPMCLAAIYWARCRKVYYGNSAQDASDAGFDDGSIYREIQKTTVERSLPSERMMAAEAMVSFDQWRSATEKTHY